MTSFIGTSMPRGYAGEITRGAFDYTTEAKENDKTTPVSEAGVFVSLTATGTATVATGTDAVYGVSLRDYRQIGPDGKPWPADRLVAILRRGYVAVQAEGTPTIGAPVYLGENGIATATQASGAEAIPGCTFMSAKDSDGLAEIAFNI